MLTKDRHGQVTLFVILSIVLLAALCFFVIKRFDLLQFRPPAVERPALQESLVMGCFKDVGLEGLYSLGEQGLIYPSAYMVSKDIKIAYFYHNGRSYFPENGKVEQDLEKYLRENVAVCIEDSNTVRPKVSVSIQDTGVNIWFNYVSGKDEFTQNVFLDVQLNRLLILARRIYDNAINDPETIDLDFGPGYDVRLIRVDPSTIIYEITTVNDGRSVPFVYRFAMKYNL